MCIDIVSACASRFPAAHDGDTDRWLICQLRVTCLASLPVPLASHLQKSRQRLTKQIPGCPASGPLRPGSGQWQHLPLKGAAWSLRWRSVCVASWLLSLHAAVWRMSPAAVSGWSGHGSRPQTLLATEQHWHQLPADKGRLLSTVYEQNRAKFC